MTWLVALAAGLTVVLAAAGWASDPSRRRKNDSEATPGSAHPPEHVGRHASDRGGRRPPPSGVGGALAVALPLVAAVAFGPTAAVVLVVLAVAVRVATIRRVRARANRLLDQSLPELVDLLIIAASAGQPVASCLASVAERSPGPLRAVLVRAHRRVQRGASLSVALTDAGPGLGTLGPTLVESLVTAHQTGSALQPALHRVAAVSRDRRSRTAEEAARRLPVTLLFPLVCCVLPAFVLLAVVPLLATSLQSLQN